MPRRTTRKRRISLGRQNSIARRTLARISWRRSSGPAIRTKILPPKRFREIRPRQRPRRSLPRSLKKSERGNSGSHKRLRETWRWAIPRNGGAGGAPSRRPRVHRPSRISSPTKRPRKFTANTTVPGQSQRRGRGTARPLGVNSPLTRSPPRPPQRLRNRLSLRRIRGSSCLRCLRPRIYRRETMARAEGAPLICLMIFVWVALKFFLNM